LEQWHDEQLRHYDEDFDTRQEALEALREYHALDDINAVRTFLGDAPLTEADVLEVWHSEPLKPEVRA